MKLIRTRDAVGHVLCHDVTQIVPGVVKGPAFRKGHVVREEDIPVLLDIGKENLYVWEKDETMLHEDEAADVLRAMCQGPHMRASEPKEGKIELTSEIDGLFLADVARLRAVNSQGQMMIAVRSPGFRVRAGDKLAGMRVIPLVIEKERMARAQAAVGSAPLLRVLPFPKRTAGVVTTGGEVFTGRIRDQFTPVIERKLAEYGCRMTRHVILGDDADAVSAAIRSMLDAGVDMVFCTGGMSVDPDDRTPLAIRQAGARVVSYGAPVLPGAMFLLGYMDDGRPVAGLPGCVMYARRTVFDLALPYLIAGEPITAEQLAGYGAGGLCLDCSECHFPNCGFGKGV